MTLPFQTPDWLPWWVLLAVVVLVVLYLLVFLVMPFSVFGLKGRLEQIEARLDEIQGDVRRLGARVPEPPTYAGKDTPTPFGRAPNAAGLVRRPPNRPMPAEAVEDRAPPRADTPLRAEPLVPPRRRTPEEEDLPGRVEPRLDWPPE
jgi:hypothetical protein